MNEHHSQGRRAGTRDRRLEETGGYSPVAASEVDVEKLGKASCRMVVCKGVIDRHVLEKNLYVLIKEALNLIEVEVRIYEYSSNI